MTFFYLHSHCQGNFSVSDVIFFFDLCNKELSNLVMSPKIWNIPKLALKMQCRQQVLIL